ncbi:MAG: WD40 repeat domain-containing serine/threonine protein kinase [Verrucomicrobiota bacterium]
MNSASRPCCPACGADAAGAGPCAACLLEDLFQESPPEPPPATPPTVPVRRLGDYELIRRLGRGAGGIVHLARQTSLNRLVALKLLHPGRTQHPEIIARFRAEAIATARLQHPNIVAIHEIGEEDGILFYSMDYVEGSTLADLVKSGPIPPVEAARLVHCLADAVEHAHSQGVLHRDLKPANILVDRLGNPRIADFGLAKLLDGDSGLTSHGDILGSPSFMSPEQADGGSAGADPSSDVYALGAILFYLLTGRPHYLGESVAATLKLVREGRLAGPRSLNPLVPEALEQICLRALARERIQRFPTASAMEEALRAFRLPRPLPSPVISRPPARFPPGWSLARLLAWAAGSAVVATLLGAASLALLRQKNQRERLVARSRYAETIRVAHREIAEGHPATARKALEEWQRTASPGETPGFEWHHLLHETRPFENRVLFQRHTPVDTLTLDPARGQLAFVTGPHLGWMQLWSNQEADLQIAEPIAGARLAISPDGQWLAVAGPRGTRFEPSLAARRSPSGKNSNWRLSGLTPASGATWSGDGSVVVLRHPPLPGKPQQEWISAWDTVTGERLPQPLHLPATWLGWAADGQTLLCLDDFQELIRWQVRSNRISQIRALSETPIATALSPGGQHLAAVTDLGRLHLVETLTGKLVAVADGLSRGPTELAFSPDGRRLASADGLKFRILLWDVPNLAPRGECEGHTDLVTGLGFLAQGDGLLSSSRDGSIRLWKLSRTALYPLVSSHLADDSRGETQFSPDGLRVAVTTLHTDSSQECRVMRLTEFDSAAPVFPVMPIAWSPDSRQILGCRQRGRLALWDVTTQRELAAFPSLTVGSWRTQMSPDGRWLASLSDEGFLHLVHVPSGQTRKLPLRPVQSWLFSPDSRSLAISGPEGPILWEFGSGRQRSLPGIIGASLAFNADGSALAVEGERGTIRGVDPANGRRRWELARHEGRVTALAFSPDGRTLVSGGEDRLLRFWMLPTGEPLASFSRIEPPISATFAPDGRWLIVGSRHAHEMLEAPGFQVSRTPAGPASDSFWSQPLETATRFRNTERFSRDQSGSFAPWK